MNTVQLECFLTVAEHLNFSKAAEEINITQPAVSHQISSLEDELGVKLFERTSKNVRLTPAGRQFINDADSIMKIAMGAKHRLLSSVTDDRIRLGIGLHSTAELYIAQSILAKLRKSYPNIYPEIRSIPFKSIDNLLADNSIQLLLSLKSLRSKGGAEYTELFKCPIACVCREDSRFAHRKSVEISELSGGAILNDKAKSHEIMMKYQRMIASHSPANETYFSDGEECCTALTKAGFGFTIAPMFPIDLGDGLIRIPISDAELVSFGIYHKPPQDNPVLKKFIEAAKETYGQK